MSFQSLIVQTIPKLRTPIQLAGLLFAVLAYTLIERVDPDNTQAIASVGILGVALVVIPLAFDAKFIREIPMAQRALFLLALVAIQLFSLGAMAYVTIDVYRTPPPEGARFDSRLEQAVFFKKPDGTSRAELTWLLFPLSQEPVDSATIFTGIVTVHDELKISTPGLGQVTPLSCKDVPSCLGNHLFRELSNNPAYVKGGSEGSRLSAVVDFRGNPSVIRIWWEFYQREGIKDARCGVNSDKLAPAEGIPPLGTFDRNGKFIGNACYRSFDQKTLKVVYQ